MKVKGNLGAVLCYPFAPPRIPLESPRAECFFLQRFSPSNPRNQLRVRWAKLKRRIGSGSAPDDHNDLTTATSDASENGSSFAGGRRQAPVGGGEEPTDEVDEVVVDQTMAFGDWGAKNSTSQGGRLSAREDGFGTGGTGTKGDGSEGSMTGRGTGWVSEQGVGQIGAWLRWRVWPLTRSVVSIAEPSLGNDASISHGYLASLDTSSHLPIMIFPPRTPIRKKFVFSPYDVSTCADSSFADLVYPKIDLYLRCLVFCSSFSF